MSKSWLSKSSPQPIRKGLRAVRDVLLFPQRQVGRAIREFGRKWQERSRQPRRDIDISPPRERRRPVPMPRYRPGRRRIKKPRLI